MLGALVVFFWLMAVGHAIQSRRYDVALVLVIVPVAMYGYMAWRSRRD